MALSVWPQNGIQAANDLYDKFCDDWRAVDDALCDLGRKYPDFSLRSCLLKTSAVNQLYGARLFYVHVPVAARTIKDFLPERLNRPLTVSDVERLINRMPKKYTVFVSKFVHFFVDVELPLQDSFCARAVKYYLTREWPRDPEWSYRTYCSELAEIKRQFKIAGAVTTRQLDRFLWVAGQFRGWEKAGRLDKGHNPELVGIFRRPDREINELLKQIAPDLRRD